MSRDLRPNCPGVAFHLVSRFTGGTHHLDEKLRPRVLEALAESSLRSDAQILAYAIMPNHLHFVVRQGSDPVFRFMQPALRRVALIVQRHCGVRGHVVERKYRLKACLSAQYLRDAIVYNHINPVRAGLCDETRMAEYTSHARYAGAEGNGNVFNERVQPALELFSTRRHTEAAQWQRDYCSYVDYRRACDRADATDQLRPTAPDTDGGDIYYQSNFATVLTNSREQARRIDFRDFVRAQLSLCDDEIPIRSLCGSQLGSRRLQKLREQIIRKAAKEGYPGVAIAAFFVMSPTRVSVLSRRRE